MRKKPRCSSAVSHEFWPISSPNASARIVRVEVVREAAVDRVVPLAACAHGATLSRIVTMAVSGSRAKIPDPRRARRARGACEHACRRARRRLRLRHLRQRSHPQPLARCFLPAAAAAALPLHRPLGRARRSRDPGPGGGPDRAGARRGRDRGRDQLRPALCTGGPGRLARPRIALRGRIQPECQLVEPRQRAQPHELGLDEHAQPAP